MESLDAYQTILYSFKVQSSSYDIIVHTPSAFCCKIKIAKRFYVHKTNHIDYINTSASVLLYILVTTVIWYVLYTICFWKSHHTLYESSTDT